MRLRFILALTMLTCHWISANNVKGYSWMANFQNVIGRTLRMEGGISDDPDDSGLLTNHGISQRQYPDLDIANLTQDQAKEIYKRDYWDILRLDEIKSDRIAWKVFDIAVNCGPQRAAVMLQKSIGSDADGIVGDMTIRRVNDLIAVKNVRPVLDTLAELQAKYYAKIVRDKPKNAKFIVGWMERAFDTGVGL